MATQISGTCPKCGKQDLTSGVKNGVVTMKCNVCGHVTTHNMK